MVQTAQGSSLPPPLPSRARRLYRNRGSAMFVILNRVKNLMISTESIREILRLSPQNDITTQPLLKRGKIAFGSEVCGLLCEMQVLQRPVKIS